MNVSKALKAAQKRLSISRASLPLVIEVPRELALNEVFDRGGTVATMSNTVLAEIN